MWGEFRKKLGHMNDEQKNELISSYYSEEISVTKLIKKYDIKGINAGQLYKCFPLESLEKACPACQNNMFTLPKSKTALNSGWGDTDSKHICINCYHAETESIYFVCDCEYCVEKRKQDEVEKERRRKIEIENKKSLIIETYKEGIVNINKIKDLTLEEVTKLGAFLDVYLDEKGFHTSPIIDVNAKFTPYDDWDYEIIRELSGKEFIKVSSFSEIDAFTGDEDVEYPKTYYIAKVIYYPAIDKHDKEIMNDIRYGKYLDSFDTFNEDEKVQVLKDAFKLWKDINLYECIDYLLSQMSKVGLSFNPGEKTIDTFNYLLEHLSVSEIYSVIYSAVTYALRAEKERNLSKRHTSNTVVNLVATNGDKIIAGDWNRRPSYRSKDAEQSHLSRFFFSRVLKIGEDGFNHRPSLDYLMEKFNVI